jgi:hypothetical protein
MVFRNKQQKQCRVFKNFVDDVHVVDPKARESPPWRFLLDE